MERIPWNDLVTNTAQKLSHKHTIVWRLSIRNQLKGHQSCPLPAQWMQLKDIHRLQFPHYSCNKINKHHQECTDVRGEVRFSIDDSQNWRTVKFVNRSNSVNIGTTMQFANEGAPLHLVHSCILLSQNSSKDRKMKI